MRKVQVIWEGHVQSFSWPLDCLLAVAAREAAMSLDVPIWPGSYLVFLDSIGNPLDAEKTLEGEGVLEDEPLELCVR